MQVRTRYAALVVALSLGAATVAEAQSGTRYLGPRVSYNFDAEEAGLGLQLGLPLTSSLAFYPSFDVFFVDPGSFFSVNADFKLRPDINAPLYFGAGLNVSRFSGGGNSDTNTGLNLLGGLEATFGAIHPFAELRVILGDGSALQLGAGLNFSFGPRSASVR
jgi:hypothetical protein